MSPTVTTGLAEYPSMEEIEATLKELSSAAWLINATEIALELGSPILTNIVMAAALVGSGAIPLKPETFEAALRESLPGDKLELNLKAARRGYEEAKNRAA